MTEPIEIEFEVACSPEHAFDTWANRTSMWWPHSHSMSSAPGLVVTFEPRPGGRIYERAPEGAEHDWGEVLAWEPPRRLAYLWHLGTDRSRATGWPAFSSASSLSCSPIATKTRSCP